LLLQKNKQVDPRNKVAGWVQSFEKVFEQRACAAEVAECSHAFLEDKIGGDAPVPTDKNEANNNSAVATTTEPT
jgi:hypothetical protein